MRHLPSRWGRFEGIEGLPLIIAASNALVFLYELVRPGLISSLVLAPAAIYAGDYWRFLTYLFVPPKTSPLFIIFWLYLLYIYADALETEWGAFRFTLYYFVGAVATALVGFFPAFGLVPNVYLNASLFLAFATIFPDFELLLFFVLPLKVKYLGYFTWLWLAWSFAGGGVLTRLSIGAALINYFLFFGPDLWEAAQLKWQVLKNRKRWDVH